ncbi:zinc finger protein CONSTANS-LIKE 16-like [Lycium barbarum]|uniref:zinc finger protein CONSTANS-LIKE 16-like n=1 Tax=Lycium barbarum TaxID=112863 RepID=UPI00293E42BD|nr:zinc finger protein CONSTANS-LIKE 16-like [Lycium barbarum]
MVSEKKLASAMGGKTARACDNCIRKRARWYCPADDAFLCQNCDASVHSANPLARRHERVRLKTSGLKEPSSDDTFPDLESPVSVSVPSWHRGFKRKARTPRNGRKFSKSSGDEEVILKNPIHLVPEILTDENSLDENEEEQLLYRVPIFDPFVVELCSSATRNHEMVENNMIAAAAEADSEFKLESKETTLQHDISKVDLNRFHGMLPSEMELAEFAADVESLLGKGLDEESFDMEGLGLLGVSNSKEENSMECSMVSHEKVKIEDEGEIEVFTKTASASTHDHQLDRSTHDIDINGDTFDFKFDYDSPMNITGEDEVGDEVVMKNINEDNGVAGDGNNDNTKKILLNLDYEGVLTAWANERSPWINGERPELDSKDCWPDCMGNYMGIMNENATIVDRGREAKVSRYREKRRTRLFSKKIRYEVRKLNAEKRPRMKGRFVKRTSFATTNPNYALVK